ncbi:hypothetical protein [Aquisalibacillus elongatus]|uniref:hypothetical protein n=1 Tax=Aquisalibacillus elongatus TaxID=485577 RepID=UPI001475CE52|nr:hypothetical protein [Aquisalibacillus elongatus]
MLCLNRDEKKRADRPTLGIKLSSQDSIVPKQEIKNAIDMLPPIISTMIHAHDSRYISKDKAKDIIFIPIKESINATDFD